MKAKLLNYKSLTYGLEQLLSKNELSHSKLKSLTDKNPPMHTYHEIYVWTLLVCHVVVSHWSQLDAKCSF